MISGVGRILGNRLRADVIDWLLEGGAAVVHRSNGLTGARPAIAPDHVQRVAFLPVEGARVVPARPDRPGVDEWHGDVHAASQHRQVLERQGRPELEGDVLNRVAVVVDVNLVDGVRVAASMFGFPAWLKSC